MGEVAQNKQQNFQGANRPLAQKLNVVGDYRRVLERNDIDHSGCRGWSATKRRSR